MKTETQPLDPQPISYIDAAPGFDQATNQLISSVYLERDNSEAFITLSERARIDIEESGGANTDILSALVSVRFTRPSYQNGSVAEEHLDEEKDRDLIELIGKVDITAIKEQPIQLAYSTLAASIELVRNGSSLGPLRTDLPAAILTAKTMEKSSPETALSVFNSRKHIMMHEAEHSDSTTSEIWEVQSRILAELAAKISHNPEDASRSIRLITSGAEVLNSLHERMAGSTSVKQRPTRPDTIEDYNYFMHNYFAELRGLVVVVNGMSDESAQTAVGVLLTPGLSRMLEGEYMYPQKIDEFVQSLANPAYSKIFREQIPTLVAGDKLEVSEAHGYVDGLAFNAERLGYDVLDYILAQKNPVEGAQRLKEVFDDPVLAEYVDLLKELHDHTGISEAIIGLRRLGYPASEKSEDIEFLKNRDYIQELMRSDVFNKIRNHHTKAQASDVDVANLRTAQLRNIVLNLSQRPYELKVAEYFNDSENLSELIDNPGVLSTFMSSGRYPEDIRFLGGIEKSMYEIYKRINNSTSNDETKHYARQLQDIITMAVVVGKSNGVVDSYLSFIDQNNMSHTEEIKALRAFSGLAQIPNLEIGSVSSIEEAELLLFDNLLDGIGITEDTSMKDMESVMHAFESLEPIAAYIQRFKNNPDYAEALSSMLRSIMDGSYSSWKYGDMSEDNLSNMISEGYLPQNITLEQYRAWSETGETSIESELAASAEDVAREIHRAVELATLDLDIIAPGFNFSEEFREELSGLARSIGQTKGTLFRARGKGVGLSEEETESVTKSLLDSKSPLMSKLVEKIQKAEDINAQIEAVELLSEKLETMNNLSRIANITEDEVLKGVLLSKSGKPQEDVYKVIDELIEQLPEEIKFVPQTVKTLLSSMSEINAQLLSFVASDTDNPKVTLEIGARPLRSCQHYATGGFNQGLIGYFGPEAKILAVHNKAGNIIGRSIVRLMQDDSGEPVLFAEPAYISVASGEIRELLARHLDDVSIRMGGVRVHSQHLRAQRSDPQSGERLVVRKLKMPATYSDTANGVNSGQLAVFV